ncbi:hypothetical protein [Rathayibacter toxicus]|nr:hypothetical protein [Rathayibacter toxicus]QOD09227.1 hypothetical protein AYW78_05305 [Rathayibacter toxicus]QOD11378.1 hypothetical protein BSG36_05490 [Rathayibacter toxicus]
MPPESPTHAAHSSGIDTVLPRRRHGPRLDVLAIAAAALINERYLDRHFT